MKILITKDVPPSADGVAPEVGKEYNVEEVFRLKSKPQAVFMYAISVNGQTIGVEPDECEELHE